MNHDSKVEHPKRPKLGFNSMFQIVKLDIQSGWCHSELPNWKMQIFVPNKPRNQRHYKY